MNSEKYSITIETVYMQVSSIQKTTSEHRTRNKSTPPANTPPVETREHPRHLQTNSVFNLNHQSGANDERSEISNHVHHNFANVPVIPGGSSRMKPKSTLDYTENKNENRWVETAKQGMNLNNSSDKYFSDNRFTQQSESKRNHFITDKTEQRINALQGGGKRLSPAVRSFFEPQFGRSLADVRVYTGPIANKAAQSIGATAFTRGKDIVFQKDKYAPESQWGRVLLGHELAHTIQQSSAFETRNSQISKPSDRSEREAYRAGLSTSIGSGAVTLSPVSESIIHRQEESGFFEEAGSTLKSIGESALSVGKDVGYGGQRIVESWGLTGLQRSAEIGAENERAMEMLVNLVKFGADVDGPLYQLIKIIIKHEIHEVISEELTPSQKEKIKSITGEVSRNAAEYIAGRILGSQAVKLIAKTIATRAATTALYKRVATQIGVSAGSSSTGIGIPVGATIAMGVVQRASNASRRLREENPMLYRELRKHNLDMGYFLVEPVLGNLKAKIRKEVIDFIEEETSQTDKPPQEKETKSTEVETSGERSREQEKGTSGTEEGKTASRGTDDIIKLEETHLKGNIYTVRPGDTLWDIARRFNVSGGWRAIWRANRETIGPNPDLIYPGQRLFIP
mgnify:FL=1